MLVLYLEESQTGTFVLADSSSNEMKYTVYGNSNVTTSQSNQGLVYTYVQAEGISAVKFSSGLLIYLLEKTTAWNFFAPALVSSPIVKPHEHIFVIGPYLVREASVRGHTLELFGDNTNTTLIE